MNRVRGALALLFVALLLAGCTPIPSPPQRSGPLEIRLDKAGQRGGAYPAPPKGLDWFACDVYMVNTSESTTAVRFKEAKLELYEGSRLITGQPEGTGATAAEASGRGFDDTSTLPPRANVYVYRDFLLKPGQRGLTLVLTLPGYGEFEWRVR